jgi:hypothetical protein
MPEPGEEEQRKIFAQGKEKLQATRNVGELKLTASTAAVFSCVQATLFFSARLAQPEQQKQHKISPKQPLKRHLAINYAHLLQ